MDFKILIGTWGKPDFWQETEYRFENLSVQSKTSLLLLKQKINPDKILIIALDTIADLTNQSPELQLDYRSLVQNRAKEKIAKFCKDNEITLNPDKDIMIATGNGSFPGLIFQGRMQDYYYLIFYLLCNAFLNIIEKLKSEICPGQNEAAKRPFDDCTIEIHLDLTHGINFMPVLTYRALKEIASLLEVFIDVRFYVYNSEPYAKDKPLQIHKIEESINLTPLFPHDYVEDNLIRLLKWEKTNSEPAPGLKQQIRALCGNLQPDDLNLFFSSLLHGLLLALISYLPEQTIISNSINNAIELFYGNFKLQWDNNTLSLERTLSLTDHFQAINVAYLILKLLDLSGIKNQKEMSLQCMSDLNKIIYKKFPLIQNIIANELYAVGKKVENVKTDQWKPLISLEVNKKPGSPDFRNFMAHAGLEKNITLVKNLNEKPFLKYDEACLNNIKDFARKAIILKDK